MPGRLYAARYSSVHSFIFFLLAWSVIRSSRQKNSDDLYLPILDNSAVKSIRSLPYSRGYKNRIRNINEEYPICTESITVEHALMVMTCCHVMHADWMLTWCLNKPTHRKTCPVCRAPIGQEIHIFTY